MMIDLLFRVGCTLAVLAAISLFVCTIPIWLVVLAVSASRCPLAA
jgi:hypothetical protein